MKHKTMAYRIFDFLNYTLLTAISITIVLPFIHMVGSSFATSAEYTSSLFLLVPRQPTLDTYRYIFSTNTLMRSLGVTVFVTVAGTLINLLMTAVFAYPLAHKHIMGRTAILNGVIFTMLFSGGMIPTFLVVRSLSLLNTYWSLLLPGAISAYNLILLKNFFQQLPIEMEESAKIDGCNDVIILLRIVMPLSLPALATFALFYAVGHWNDFFSCLLYINDSRKWNVQVLLRQIVIMSTGGIGDIMEIDANIIPPAQTIKMATIVVSTFPIVCVYPFLQRYFAKGLLLGSVKG